MKSNRTALALVGAIAALAWGCGSSHAPTSPGRAAGISGATRLDAATAAPSSGFYPLAVGNRWDYLYEFDVTLRPTGQPPTTETYRDSTDERIVCSEELLGRTYAVARRLNSGPVSPYWIRYRQDHAGLYELDDYPASPPPCDSAPAASALHSRELPGPTWSTLAGRLGNVPNLAAWQAAWQRLEVRRAALDRLVHEFRQGGPQTGEIQRLAYPLNPNQSWVIRGDPPFTAEVERGTSLDTPAGTFRCWAVRIRSELFGPRDVIRFWYGRDGAIGYEAYFYDAAMVDESGMEVGTVDAFQGEILIGLSLVQGGVAANDR